MGVGVLSDDDGVRDQRQREDFEKYRHRVASSAKGSGYGKYVAHARVFKGFRFLIPHSNDKS